MIKNIFLLLVTFAVTIPGFGQTKNNYWPKQIEVNGNFILTIYAPEPEGIKNNVLNARAAFSIYDKEHLPLFGAMWFRCRVNTDVKKNEVFFTNIQLVNVNFPDANADNIEQMQNLIEEQAQFWQFNSDLASFYKEIDVVNINNAYNEELSNNPPKIYFAKEPTILVFIDGDPILANISGSALYQYVVNTPHFIVKSESDRQYYLKGDNWWYVSNDPTASWKSIETPPNQVRLLAEKATELNAKQNTANSKGQGKQPKLIVTREPAELIQSVGEPEIEQIYENLFSISNSNDEIIFDSYTDTYFILISGRWYKTKNLERGTWTFVSPENLPDVFKEIPSASPFAHVRLSIPGTPESISAALDNGIPQTAIVDRLKTKMLLEYDGQPQFKSIEGTSLSYGINTGGSVIKVPDSTYYAVDQAVWFTSNSATGPWKIAVHFPDEVRRIPPNCPVFNMKFVYIYDYTDEIVYVGYTAGYLGAFLYHGVVYYGTGYRYKSWYGDKYIPRPTTYGYGAKKKSSPNVHVYVGVGYGAPMMGMGYGGYGRYGGYGYGGYGGYGMGYGGYGMMNQMAYNQYYYQGQTVQIDHDVIEEKPIDLANIYNNRSEGVIRTETAPRNDPMKPVILNDRNIAPNYLYADEDGHVYRQDEEGNWYERKDSEWQETDKSISH